MTKVLIVDNGIEFDSLTVRERPSGGAETAFVSLVEELAKLDLDIKVYNNAKNTGNINGVSWNKLSAKIYNESFDAIIINRGDKFLNFKNDCKKRIFWIHNPAQYLVKWRYLSKIFFNPLTIVFSSKYHFKTYPSWAPNKNKVIIPYGVDEQLLQQKKIKKILEPKAIFTSNPLRGLDWLLDRWEYEIHLKLPKAKLFLYTGSDTYGEFGNKNKKKMGPILKRARNLIDKGVILKKPIKRDILLKEISKSRVFLYQGDKNETFCMSVAEAQLLGVPSIVSNLGCMNERVRNKITGYVCNSDKDFSESAIKILKDDDSWNLMHNNMINNHQDYYSWSEIAKLWKKLIT